MIVGMTDTEAAERRTELDRQYLAGEVTHREYLEAGSYLSQCVIESELADARRTLGLIAASRPDYDPM
jgi:hypothetical protein